MKRKVRITKMPQLAEGGVTKTGTQRNYGLYRNERFVSGENNMADDRSIRSYYPESPRDEADIEVEKGELIVSGDMSSMYKVGGKKHSQGGTPVKATPGDYVVSDYIQAPKILQDSFGFDSASKKKKHNTWAAVLNRKVDAKDYNRLVDILKQASEGKDVDPFELATARARVPDYQKYISRAALGNEVSKAMEGRPFEIPQIGMQAMQSLVGPSREETQDDTMAQAKFGGRLEKYQSRPGTFYDNYPSPMWLPDAMPLTSFVNDDYQPWPGDRYQNKDNASNMTAEEIAYTAKALGYNGPRNNLALQKWLLKNHPESKAIIEELHRKYGLPKAGRMDDGKWGYRWQMAMKELQKKIPTIPSTDNSFGTTDVMEESKYACTPDGVVAVSPDSPMYYDGNLFSSESEALKACYGKEDSSGTTEKNKSQTTVDKIDPNFSNTDGRKIKPRPYIQDINNLGNALTNYYDRDDFGPKRIKINPNYIDPVFVSTEAIDNLLAGQYATAAQEAQAYGRNAQSQSAILSDLQARVLPEMIKNRVSTNMQNVQTDMAARQFNAQLANQAALADAQFEKTFVDESARFLKNRRDSRVAGRTLVNNALNTLQTNMGNTYLMNQRYPQMAFDPMSYEVYFKNGSGKTDVLDGSSAGVFGGPTAAQYDAKYKEFYDGLKSLPARIREQTASERADDFFGLSGRTTKRFNPYEPFNNSQISQTTPGVETKEIGGVMHYPFW